MTTKESAVFVIVKIKSEKKTGYGWQNACDTCLSKDQWAPRCDGCFLKHSEKEVFSKVNDFSDVNTGKNKIEEAVKEVKGNICYQQEVIQKFLAKNVSTELCQELNLAFQKLCELEKIAPKFEKKAREYVKKLQACRGEFVCEKGGEQFNIYEYCLCDKCKKELTKIEEKIENDYRVEVSDKLKVLSEEMFDRIAAEIGIKEVDKVIWTSGNTDETEEEFEERHKKIKESLERQLKEGKGVLNPSQIDHLKQKIKFYNEWEKSSDITQESKKKVSEKEITSNYFIIGIISCIILGIFTCLLILNRKIKMWRKPK